MSLTRAGNNLSCSLLGVSSTMRSLPCIVGFLSPKHVMSMYLISRVTRLIDLTYDIMVDTVDIWMSELSEEEAYSYGEVFL